MVAFIGARPRQKYTVDTFNLTFVAPHFKGNPVVGDKGMKSDVFVNAYERIRFGRVEHVCAHWRGRPH